MRPFVAGLLSTALSLILCGCAPTESSPLEEYEMPAWTEFFEGMPLVGGPSRGNLEFALSPDDDRIIFRYSVVGKRAPGFYVFDPDERSLRLSELAEDSFSELAWFSNNNLEEPCWSPVEDLTCERGALRSENQSPIELAGEYCVAAGGLRSGRYAVILSANGPVKSSPLPMFGGREYLGNAYQQVYDRREKRIVGDSFLLPFRWSVGWNHCPSPDDEYVMYLAEGYKFGLVFAPTQTEGN